MHTCWNSSLYILVSSCLYISSRYVSYSLLFFRMTRKYVCKSNHGKTPTDILERVVKLVIQEKRTVRFVAGQFGTYHVTLWRYVKRRKETPEEQNMKGGYAKHKQVFTEQQEELIEDYVKLAANIYFGLASVNIRRLAYHYAAQSNLPM